MRIFTAIMACALVFSACSKEENGLVPADDSVLTRAREVVGFNKVKLIDGVQIPAEDGEFAFELYEANKNSGTYEKIGEYPTLNGGVWIEFTEFSPGKKYLFREIPKEGWEPIEDLPFTLVANSKSTIWGNVPYPQSTGPTVVNIPIVPERILGEEIGGGITLTNDAATPLVYPRTNDQGHFCYAELTVADLAEGVTLDMVKNAKFDNVGQALVKLEEGIITVTIDGEASYRGFALSEPPAVSTSSPNSMLEEAPIECPEGETVYLYVFFDSVRFWIYQ